MRPERIGRVLGIGLRVAGRVAGERVRASAQAPAAAPPAGASAARTTADFTQRGRKAVRASGGLFKAIGGFLKPFRRVGGIVWLEVVGVFFFLPVLVFAPTFWRTRASFLHGPDHRTCIASAVMVVVFFYLGVTSFWRARRKARAGQN